MSQDKVAAILADTKAHGFRFSTEVVKRDGRPYAAEIVVVEDLVKFDAAFPGVALTHCNGSSTRVGSQAISRLAGGKVKPDELRTRNVKWLLGIDEPTVREVEVYMFHGERYETVEDMEAAVELWAEEQLQKA